LGMVLETVWGRKKMFWISLCTRNSKKPRSLLTCGYIIFN
jgi:hypothetical protein